MRMRDANDFGDRNRRGEDIRHMRDRDYLRALRQQAFEMFERKTAVFVNLQPFQHGAFAFAQKVPRHDVGVVLHRGENDLVAFLDIAFAI